MLKRIGRVLGTALLGCGTLAAIFISMLALTILGVFHYNFAIDVFTTFTLFMLCWGVGRLVLDQWKKRAETEVITTEK